MRSFRYSRWDARSGGDDVPVEDLLDQLADDFVAQGDLGQAVRRLVHRGATRSDGVRMTGVQDLMQQLKDRRTELLEQFSLDGIHDRLQQGVAQALNLERQSIRRRLRDLEQPQEDATPDDAWQANLYRQLAEKHLADLEEIPDDLGGSVEALRTYDFLDQEARGRFDEVLGELQRAVLDSFFNDVSQRLEGLIQEDLNQMERMVSAIHEMAEERLQGQVPDFQGFMQEFGHLFGDNPPESLDQLLSQIQAQMTRMQSLVNSLSTEQQRALRDTVNRQLLSAGLDEALAGLSRILWDQFPYRQRGQGYAFSGEESVSMDDALKLMGMLHDLDVLERQFDKVRFGTPVTDVDRDKVKDALGDQANDALDALGRVSERLEDAGLARHHDGKLVLTPRGARRIGQKAMVDVFRRLKGSGLGNHSTSATGSGHELTDDTRPYEFGQPFHLHLERTLRNALVRSSGGTPVQLTAADFEVVKTERTVRTATVLMLDLSRSMPMRGNFTAAKKVALALNQLIRTQFPRDQLYLVGFSGFARQMSSEELPGVEVGEFGRGTNMQAGLAVARRLLAHHKGVTRQIIMITDGEPTAYAEQTGQVIIEFPPSRRVLRVTMDEVRRCTREDITINVFMLERSYGLRGFVQQMAQSNHGRVFFTGADQLGEYLLEDYLSNKRRILS